jgi:hypothetical protein
LHIGPVPQTGFALLAARSREVGVVTEMRVANSEQVSDDRDAPPDYCFSGHDGLDLCVFQVKATGDRL